MKVKELIEQLSKLDPEKEVIVEGSDPTGFNYYNQVEKITEQILYRNEECEFIVEDEDVEELEQENQLSIVLLSAGMF